MRIMKPEDIWIETWRDDNYNSSREELLVFYSAIYNFRVINNFKEKPNYVTNLTPISIMFFGVINWGIYSIILTLYSEIRYFILTELIIVSNKDPIQES